MSTTQPEFGMHALVRITRVNWGFQGGTGMIVARPEPGDAYYCVKLDKQNDWCIQDVVYSFPLVDAENICLCYANELELMP